MSVPTEAEATQRPAPSSMAEAFDMTDPELTGAALSNEGGVPADAGTGEPVVAAEATQSDTATQEAIDYKAEYERAQQERISRAAAELANAGRLKKANEELAALKAERDEYKRLFSDENARLDKLWADAIAQAPDQPDDPRIASKAELQRQYAIEKREREIGQKEQAQQFTEQQTKQMQEAQRLASVQDMRQHATAELPHLIDGFARNNQLPPELFKPVKDYVDSPQMRAIAKNLSKPFSEQYLPGDPALWPVDQIDSVHGLRLHLEAQAEAGVKYFTEQHEQRHVAANAQKATETYQPERAVGAGVARPARDLSKYRNSNNIAAVLDIEDGIDP